VIRRQTLGRIIRKQVDNLLVNHVEDEFKSVLNAELAKYPSYAAADRAFTQGKVTRDASVRISNYDERNNQPLLGGDDGILLIYVMDRVHGLPPPDFRPTVPAGLLYLVSTAGVTVDSTGGGKSGHGGAGPPFP
jgi:hypothetical protein